jgi:D-alanine-D-alanine ligase
VEFPDGVPKICSYEAKWDELSPLYKKTVPVCPADLPAAQTDEMANIAISAYDVMGCRDYARIDMRVGADGKAKVLEVNPNPDIYSNAGLARAAKAAGFNYQSFIAEVVRLSWARYDSAVLFPAPSKAVGAKR